MSDQASRVRFGFLSAPALHPGSEGKTRHARASGHPGGAAEWIPACAGMTNRATDLISLLFTVIACLLMTSITAAHADDGRPAALRGVNVEQRLNTQLPLDLTFRDESGQPVRLAQYFTDKPVILNLVYYECPMLCTLVLNGLTSALGVLSFDVGKEFEVITVSFSPTETPELAAAKKRTYLQRYGRTGAEAGWHFLTGDASAIEQLTNAVGFQYTYDPALKQYAHAAAIMVLTPQGRISHYFFGVEYAPKDLRLGLIEASHNQIGSAVDQLLLFCYHYDPVTGRYGVVAMNMVRIAGALTVFVLATFMIVMFRRDARRKRRVFETAVGGVESPVTSTSHH